MDYMETWQVTIEPGSVPPDEVVALLNDVDLPADEIDVQIRRPQRIVRGADATIIVATISAVSASLTAVITGLMALRAGRSTRQITIARGDDRLEFPVGTSPAELRAYLDILEDTARTRLILPAEGSR
jgi:hypothetical protein